MLIDVTKNLKSFSGSEIKDINEKGEVIDATVRLAIVNALLAHVQKAETGVEKIKKYELAKKIYNNDEVNLTVEEATLIKDRVGETLPALIVGQIFELIDSREG